MKNQLTNHVMATITPMWFNCCAFILHTEKLLTDGQQSAGQVLLESAGKIRTNVNIKCCSRFIGHCITNQQNLHAILQFQTSIESCIFWWLYNTVSNSIHLRTNCQRRHHWTKTHTNSITKQLTDSCNIYVKNCSVYIQCKGDIVVVGIKQHKSQFKNSNITINNVRKTLLTV